MTVSMVRARVREGSVQKVLPGVFRFAGGGLTTEDLIRAVGQWGGKGAVIIGHAAAWWWELTDAAPSTIDLAIRPTRNLRSGEDVRVRRLELPAEDVTTHRRLRVASLPFAALFGSVAMGAAGRAVLDRALLRRVTMDEIVDALERNRCRTGAATARRWVKEASDGSASEAERLFARLLRNADITGWVVNRTRKEWGAKPDFTFEAARLIVEIDGWAHHSDSDAFERDRARQNRIVLAGWTVLRFTWRQLQDEPDRVIAEVRGALHRF
ncbi:DUF559 domain-containing protein [Nakamurella alba]|uniref:DUF559 domain-containing protein n=1 Tax=Nakamurella alba TaxID=2665158 RepID=UPI0018AA31DA|nr:DUF559 domain-containing protein [Nakamurella alba]